MGTEIIDHLTDLLPEHLQDVGIIRPYNACFSKKYRRAVMRAFKEGSVRILVCTDAAGMGCNIPDVDLVVQWKLPTSVSAFVQWAGRAARSHDHLGLAVLLVEPSTYSIMLDEKGNKLDATPSGTDKTKTKKAASTPAEKARAAELKKLKKNHAKVRGVQRGSLGGRHNTILSGTCQRRVLGVIYGHVLVAVPSVPCCDICCPELLNRTRPGKRPKNTRAKVVKRGEPCQLVIDAVVAWRSKIKARDFKDVLFTSDGLVSDEVVDLLANVGPIQCPEQLSAAVSGQWGWEETYGDELLQELLKLDIPPLIPLPTAPKAALKRPVVNGQEQGAVVTKKQKKTVKATQTANYLTGAQPLFVIEGYSQSPQMCRVCHLLEVLEEGEVQEHWMK
ncbi:unnamed protein product [Cyclocybe aegerita]|uniref:DNA 3'-5' helicase n=1 Tax=Cyclocybe aegerita TaxID=1973307 RepID=A0A8S0WHI9_CYCAE|nr:unnamed protein product [Cyclocybe aegerita]